MLETTKSTTLTGVSKVEDDGRTINVVSMTANIKSDGASNVNTTIINQTLYESNKKQCRADIDGFNQIVREIEDSEVQ